MDAGEKLRILVVVGRFPAISSPFILNQVTGLIDMGHDVSIFAMHVVDQGIEHNEIEKYKLREKLYVLDNTGSSRGSKFRYVVTKAISLLLNRPAVMLRAVKGFLTGRYPLSLKFFRQLNSVASIADTSFDIIHAQFGPQGNMMVMLRDAGALSGKLVTQFRGFDVSLMTQSEGEDYYHSLFESGDLFLPVCEYIKDKVILMGAPENRTLVQYSGIDVNKFEYKTRQPGQKGPLKIGSVGRLTAKKGYEYVIKALKALKNEGFDFTYQIVGDGELKNEISDLVEQCNLNQEIVLLGSRNHEFISGFLHDIDIFISHNITADSGDEEGIPNTLKEAMLSGVPVFSTRHGGIPELVIDEVNGFLTEEKNIQQLVDKLKEFAFSSQDLSAVTSRAREVVLKMFDNNKLNSDLVNRYYSILR
jgi:colanic acid/amylovoran biosynthesis glycosyltransferase